MPQADTSLSVAQRVDAACDRFESQWLGGKRPRIEDFLAKVPSAIHGDVLRALMAVELELLARDGQRPTEADYHRRFPDHGEAISEVFSTLIAKIRGTGETSVSRESAVTGPLGAKTPPTADNSPEPLATRIGRFQVIGVLGEGAFGRIYRAKDPQLGREVAIKVPFDKAVQTDADRERFLREARAAAGIHHPNVCPVHEVGEADGKPYIVMAMIPGESLSAIIKSRKQPLPEKQAAVIIRKLALALEAAHHKGVVHRDLKPANVMFDRERKDVVVTDFGLARGPQLSDGLATQSGIIMGTPAYMSPEQARGESKAVGPAADIYSLGVIFYELLAGCRPFTGTVTEVIGQILHVEPASPSKHREGIDPRLEMACMKAIAKDPAVRFASMKEFAAAMDGVLRAPAGSTTDTAKPGKTTNDAEASVGTDTRRLADIFAAMSAERKQETEAAMERAVRKARTPRWVFVIAGLILVGGLTAIAGLVFFTKSDKVKVTIELTDVDLSDKSLSFFLDDKPISAEALANPIELKPGEYVLVVKRGEEIVKRLNLSVSGGRSPGIKVKDITPQQIPPPPPPSKDPDRVAAEWVLSVGGTVYVSDPKLIPANIYQTFSPTHVQTRDQLPRTPFKLISAILETRINPSNEKGLAKLNGLKNLRLLGLMNTSMTDLGLETLKDLPELTQLNLQVTGITNAGLKSVARFRALEWLGLSHVPLSDKGVAELTGLTNLTSLSLQHTKIGDDGLKHIAKLKKLNYLNIGNTQVTDAGMAELAGLTELTQLYVSNPKFTGAGMKHLHGLPRLATLEIGDGAGLTDDGLASFPGLKQLNWLRLDSANNVSDAGLKHLAGLANINTLIISSNRLTDDGLAHLSKLDQLTFLALLEAKFTDDALKHLAPLWRLQRLDFTNAAVTGTGIKHLAKLGQLKYIRFLDCPVTDSGLVSIPGLKALEALDLVRTKVADEGLDTLGKVSTLKQVDLSGSPVTNDGLLRLKKALPDCNIIPAPVGKLVEPKKEADSGGFVPLFNGKDLTGWKTHASQPGNFKVVDGVLVSSGPNVSHLYSARDDFKDFHLRAEMRINNGGNSGIMFRSPFGPTIVANKKPTWVAGYSAKFDSRRFGGLLIDTNPELHRTREIEFRSGEWITYEIIARGNHLVVKLNSQTTADYTDAQNRYTAGHIVLQQHTPATVVEFRKIEIKELQPVVADGFVSLFNGKDLTGWESMRAESFSVDADGNIVAAGDTLGSLQWLMTTKDYSDYVLRLEFLIVKGPPTHTNSGIAIRALPRQTGENGAKLRVQIRNEASQKPRPGAVVYTGADYIEPTTPPTPKPAGEWNTMEIEVRGPQVKVSMNGKPANEVDLSKIDQSKFTPKEKGYASADLERRSGRIGLQSFRGEIKFRNIQIKELDARKGK